MIDPPREESKKAVADAKRGGIRTVMITGDHKVTATAIAKEIGIFQEGDIAVSGVELDKMSDEELDKKLEHISVYARVSPEHKIRIVDAWQKKGTASTTRLRSRRRTSASRWASPAPRFPRMRPR